MRSGRTDSGKTPGKTAHFTTLKGLLLQGANGSGKSTVLETIAALWKAWGDWIDAGPEGPYGRGEVPSLFPVRASRSRFFDPESFYLSQARIAALEIAGLLPSGQSLWIGIGREAEWRELRNEHPSALISGLVRTNAGWILDLPPGDWKSFRNQSIVGVKPVPNVVYLPPEDRRLPERRFSGPALARITDATRFNWLARYDPSLRFEDIVLTIQALESTRFERFLKYVNLALKPGRKEIVGFGDQGRLNVIGTTADGREFNHFIDKLSSGEKQMLVMIGFVVAFLRPGGILLIDEPDLHIHRAMTTQLMQTLDIVVQERGAQMIVTSHAETVWEFFSRTTEKVDMSPWWEHRHGAIESR